LGKVGDTPKICSGFLLLADTRHVLKFCKDLFRVIDKIGWGQSSIYKTEGHAKNGTANDHFAAPPVAMLAALPHC